MRLDLAVSRAFGLSRRAARDAVRAGRVDSGGETLDEPGLDVAEDVRLELHASRPARRRVRTRLAVLHDDEAVLIVDKPAGLLTVPTEAREKDTLWSRALLYLQHRYGGRPYAGIVHRLDKDTSGAVVFARSRPALHFLQARFKEHAVEREYLALVAGRTPDTGSFEAELVRTDGLRRSIARPGERGRRAVTRFKTLEHFSGVSLVAARLETGRTHQIRIHFSAAGHPVLGDRVYGSPGGAEVAGARTDTDEAPRQMLHARTLGFAHPETGAPLSVESPLPADFAERLQKLRSRKNERPGAKSAGPPKNRDSVKKKR